MAISIITRNATIILSGTFLDNKWSDCIGLLSLLEGHPFADAKLFDETFASLSETGKPQHPTTTRIKRIQKFLMGVAIAHPKRILQLAAVDDQDIESNLSSEEAAESNALHEHYSKAVSQYPREKIIIFALTTAVLDLVAIVLNSRGVTVFKYDGRLSTDSRDTILLGSRPLQTQANTPYSSQLWPGGIGLDVPEVSIVIQMEPWWNVNWEEQALGRAYRHGQTKVVKRRRLIATNAATDQKLLSIQRGKNKVNKDILECIVGEDEEEIDIPVVFTGS
ncbi:MAG: hypothetical protein Q9170_004007 [Blastenia crenularia]